MIFDYEDDILDVINTINGALIKRGLQIELSQEDLDGYEKGELIESDIRLGY